MATNTGFKILRKRNIVYYSDKSESYFLNKLNISFDSFLEKNIDLFNKEWNISRSFYDFNQENLGKMHSIYEGMRYFFNLNTLEELSSVQRYNLFVQSLKPYLAQTGYLQNDNDPSIGRLSNFDYLGEFAFDYRLRSLQEQIWQARNLS